jgi:ssDNA-binding Zn-finger/Zn-ribbon topoisomerase 1
MARERELRVPFALTLAGELASPLTAALDTAHACPDCKGSVTLRRRRGQRPHFTHLASPSGGCSAESVTHKAAKLLLSQRLEQELKETKAVRWDLRCPGVNGSCREKAILPQQQALPSFTHVALEVPYADFRFDVAVLGGERVLMGFEVYFRHRVPEAKAERLDLPWLELAAEDILEFKPRVPYRDSVSTTQCPDCEVLARRLLEREQHEQALQEVDALFQAEQSNVQQAWLRVLAQADLMKRKWP